MATAEPNYECPVCHEDYTDPKILRCTHVVCRKCIVTWLRNEGNQGGCPLCRSPILPASIHGPDDHGNAVDAFPSDLVMAAMIESRHIVQGPNKCVCDDSTEAKFLCLHCRIKLCNTCAKSHVKIPGIQQHILEDLSKVSEEKLAGFQQSSCSNHGNKITELYCRSHKELICLLCATSDHRKCLDVCGINEEAKIQREELKKQMERFKEKQKAVMEMIKALDRQITDGKAKFQMKRDEIKATVDDLHKSIDEQFQKLTRKLDEIERKDACLVEKKASRAKLDTYQAGLGAHTCIIEKVTSASDEFLLGIQTKLKPRLDGLESKPLCDKVSEGATELDSISFDANLVSTIKELIFKLGEAKGPGLMDKNGSQQSHLKGQESLEGAQQGAFPSKHRKITYHKSDSACKPLFQKGTPVQTVDMETWKKLMRAFKDILNELTPQNYNRLSRKAIGLKIDTEKHLQGICYLLYEKAISDPESVLYARLCKDMLVLPKVPRKRTPNEWLTFRALFLTKCQKEFESHTFMKGNLDKQCKDIEKTDDEKSQLLPDPDAVTIKVRQRFIGIICLIGELYQLKFLTESIIHDCIFKLLKTRDDDSIECLCKLLKRIGKDLDHPKAKASMDEYFAAFEKMTAVMTGAEDLPWEQKDPKVQDPKQKLCAMVRCSVLEIMDMRRNNWGQSGPAVHL